MVQVKCQTYGRLKEIKVPTLILAGEYDEKFVQIEKWQI